MKKILFMSMIGILFLQGCTSMGSKNTQFVYQKKSSDKPSTTINLCRTSNVMATFTQTGVVINGAPAFDLNNNERYSIDLPKGDQTFKFVLPSDKFFELKVPDTNKEVYMLFDIKMDGFYVLVTSHKWQARIVDLETYNRECTAKGTIIIKHNTL